MANHGMIVSWHCPTCRRCVPIEDERTWEAYQRAYLERHRREQTVSPNSPEDPIGAPDPPILQEVRRIEEWHCPKCALIIRVPRPNTMAVGVKLHLKKHEIRGE